MNLGMKEIFDTVMNESCKEIGRAVLLEKPNIIYHDGCSSWVTNSKLDWVPNNQVENSIKCKREDCEQSWSSAYSAVTPEGIRDSALYITECNINMLPYLWAELVLHEATGAKWSFINLLYESIPELRQIKFSGNTKHVLPNKIQSAIKIDEISSHYFCWFYNRGKNDIENLKILMSLLVEEVYKLIDNTTIIIFKR